MLKEEINSKLSIIIPAKNEEASIGEVISACQPYSEEIIVVDGHSSDQTRAIAHEMGAKVVLDNKLGKGDAIRVGLKNATRDIIVFLDADVSHEPKDIPKLIEPIITQQADHVSASRLLGGSSEMHGTFSECLRLMGSSFITACINWRFKVTLSESQNGFRAIKKEVATKLDLKENISTIEQEMIMKTLKKGYRMAEVPSHEYKRKFGASHIKLSRVFFRYIYCLLKNLI